MATKNARKNRKVPSPISSLKSFLLKEACTTAKHNFMQLSPITVDILVSKASGPISEMTIFHLPPHET